MSTTVSASTPHTSDNPVNPDSARCDFYLVHKRRFCKTEKRPSYRFCHTHQAEVCGDENPMRKRVPCPVNPNHTIYERDVERHVLVCPDNRHDTSKLPYFAENCHALKGARYDGGVANLPVHETLSLVDDVGEHADEKTEERSSSRITHRDLTATELQDLCAKVTRLFREHIAPCIRVSHATAVDSDAVKRTTTKHTSQHMGLLQQVRKCLASTAAPEDVEEVVVELGAGKGGLAHAVSALMPDLLDAASGAGRKRVFVIDVGGFRRKRDGCVSKSDNSFHRLRINIKDLALSKVPDFVLGDRRRLNIVATGKHLCGACTDFAISCVTTRLPCNAACSVLVIATCCHQLCELRHINPLTKHDANLSVDDSDGGGVPLVVLGERITAREFAAIASMTSWAVCGAHSVSEEQRAVGYACKRLIDWMRLLHLRDVCGMQCELHEYVSKDVTAENVCLVAWGNNPPVA